MSTCFDFRLMREDRGFSASPSGRPGAFTPLMHEMISPLADYPSLRELMLTGSGSPGPRPGHEGRLAIYPGDILPAKANGIR